MVGSTLIYPRFQGVWSPFSLFPPTRSGIPADILGQALLIHAEAYVAVPFAAVTIGNLTDAETGELAAVGGRRRNNGDDRSGGDDIYNQYWHTGEVSTGLAGGGRHPAFLRVGELDLIPPDQIGFPGDGVFTAGRGDAR